MWKHVQRWWLIVGAAIDDDAVALNNEHPFAQATSLALSDNDGGMCEGVT